MVATAGVFPSESRRPFPFYGKPRATFIAEAKRPDGAQAGRFRGIASAYFKAMAESFGRRLQRLRQERRITVAELARAAGVSDSAIRQLESGSSKSASFAVGLRISEFLEVEPRLLAFGDSSPLTVTATLREILRRVAQLESQRAGPKANPTERRVKRA